MPEFSKGLHVFVILFFAIILPISFIVSIRNRRLENKKELHEPDWEFGDEWKTAEDKLDLDQWEEIFTETEGYSRIYDRAVPIMRRETVDVNALQAKLAEHQIPSRVAPSTRTQSPATGLFVEKKFADEAKRILQFES